MKTKILWAMLVLILIAGCSSGRKWSNDDKYLGTNYGKKQTFYKY